MTSRRYARGERRQRRRPHQQRRRQPHVLPDLAGRQSGRPDRHGIDAAALRKSATLYLDVIQHLVSGSDYADLAAVLDRAVTPWPATGRWAITPGDCRNVHRATLATAAAHHPAARQAAPRRPDDVPAGPARCGCCSTPRRETRPAGSTRGPTWVRAPNQTVFPPVAANATSGHRSWFSSEPGHDGQLADDASRRPPDRSSGVPAVPAVAAPGGRHEPRRHPGELRRRHGRGR